MSDPIPPNLELHIRKEVDAALERAAFEARLRAAEKSLEKRAKSLTDEAVWKSLGKYVGILMSILATVGFLDSWRNNSELRLWAATQLFGPRFRAATDLAPAIALIQVNNERDSLFNIVDDMQMGTWNSSWEDHFLRLQAHAAALEKVQIQFATSAYSSNSSSPELFLLYKKTSANYALWLKALDRFRDVQRVKPSLQYGAYLDDIASVDDLLRSSVNLPFLATNAVKDDMLFDRNIWTPISFKVFLYSDAMDTFSNAKDKFSELQPPGLEYVHQVEAVINHVKSSGETQYSGPAFCKTVGGIGVIYSLVADSEMDRYFENPSANASDGEKSIDDRRLALSHHHDAQTWSSGYQELAGRFRNNESDEVMRTACMLCRAKEMGITNLDTSAVKSYLSNTYSISLPTEQDTYASALGRYYFALEKDAVNTPVLRITRAELLATICRLQVDFGGITNEAGLRDRVEHFAAPENSTYTVDFDDLKKTAKSLGYNESALTESPALAWASQFERSHSWATNLFKGNALDAKQ